MAQTQNLGIYQLPNGNWGYRFTRTVDGKRVNRNRTLHPAFWIKNRGYNSNIHFGIIREHV